MARGECNCGAVQFEIDADPSGVYVCHCSICRRSTGSNGIAVVVVPNDQLMFVPAGAITQGGDALRVIHHIWVGSKAAWDEIGDSGKQHAEEYRG